MNESNSVTYMNLSYIAHSTLLEAMGRLAVLMFSINNQSLLALILMASSTALDKCVEIQSYRSLLLVPAGL